MSIGSWISELIDAPGKVGVIVGALILIVIVWLASVALGTYYPEASGGASVIIGLIFVVVILYIVFKYGKDYT